jgi:hypothetical protein
METLKEVLIDAVLLLGAWFLVTASGLHKTAEGMSCGRAAEVTQSQP